VTTDNALECQLADVARALELLTDGAPRASVLAIADRCRARHRDALDDVTLTAAAAVAAACACCCEPATPNARALLDQAHRTLQLTLEVAGLTDAG
jgi:hypothetical protein